MANPIYKNSKWIVEHSSVCMVGVAMMCSGTFGVMTFTTLVWWLAFAFVFIGTLLVSSYIIAVEHMVKKAKASGVW